jgi:predicted metal-dependent hydrolase
MAVSLHPKSTAATRTVTTRRVGFGHDLAGERRHIVGGEALTSHVLAVLSAVIPPGERFVADTVRRYRDDVDGPLRDQAKAFVGQEHVHQREHDRFNKSLARLGYPTAVIDRASGVTFAIASRFPRRVQVAMTAAIEHWTAIIAEHILEGDALDALGTPDETRDFLAWHLVEELEHRAVAFDTMQAVGTSERERILAMRLVEAMLLPPVLGGLLLSLATDPSAWRPRQIGRSLHRVRHNALTRPSFLRDLLSYDRKGFHPDARDIDHLLERWRAELFGPEGSVTARRGRPTP